MEKKHLDEIIEIKFMKVSSERRKVLARATIEFETFTLGGFKILEDDNKKAYVTPPSYKSGGCWRMTFITKREDDWEKLKEKVLEEYNLWLIKEAADELNTM